MKDAIINNPLRILGVYVGDSPAVEQKNLARIRAFEKVGQTYNVALSCEEGLPPIERTEQRANEALQCLSLPMDRIRHSLLWYSDGSTEWGRKLNKAVTSILKGDYASAISEYDKLITTPQFREDFVSAVTHGLGNSTQYELAEILREYLGSDKGFKDFENALSTSNVQIPNCLLSKWIYKDRPQQMVKSSVSLLNDLENSLSKGFDFYKFIAQLKEAFEKVLSEISLCKKVFGVESIEYQECAIQVAQAGYDVSKAIILKIGEFTWNKKYQILPGSYVKYQTQLPLRALKECMRLIEEIDSELSKFITSLQLNPTSETILYFKRQSYQTILNQEHVTDENVLQKANRRFYLKRGITIALWLFFVGVIIFASMK